VQLPVAPLDRLQAEAALVSRVTTRAGCIALAVWFVRLMFIVFSPESEMSTRLPTAGRPVRRSGTAAL
jgi:hypothetical protein